MDSPATNHRQFREQTIELPTKKDGYSRTLLLGMTGAGKTTLLRRLIGSDPARERFPSTSINRTTTCEIEVVVQMEIFQAVVTFLSYHQTQQEVTESVSSAVLKALEGADDVRILREFLEQSDMRFRLKYILGGWDDPLTEDEYLFDSEESASGSVGAKHQTTSPEPDGKFLREVVERIRQISTAAKNEVECVLGPLDTLSGDEHEYALDEIQQAAEESDGFVDLIAEVMDEIASRFSGRAEESQGKFLKSSTGWPNGWTISLPKETRNDFISEIRWFSAIAKDLWGGLLTPLVTGIRLKGQLVPDWSPTELPTRIH